MTPSAKQIKVTGIIVAIVMLFLAGYGVATWRHKSWVAGYSQRELENMATIKANEAKQAELRTANEGLRTANDELRAHAAKLSAEDEGLKTIIENRGGQIAAEAKNLEAISEALKTDQAVISNPTDKCVRCRAYSDDLLRAKQIGRPLTCKDECPGTNR